MISPMFDPLLLVFVAFTFLLAGFVKGVIGIGMQIVPLALLTALIGLPKALALLLAPSFLANLWQAVTGGYALVLLRRIWGFLLPATLLVFAGAAALTRLDLSLLSALLGLILVFYGVVGLSRVRLTISRGQEPWTGWVAGSLNGLLTGMTGSFVVPGVMWLQAIGLPRDQLIQAMGLLFVLSTAALALALGRNNMLSLELGALSLIAVIPAMLGLYAGQALRRRMEEELFRKVLLLALVILGLYIVVRSIA
jgi:uncharacterized membrane protein YfcA